jgi:hypothetical protein
MNENFKELKSRIRKLDELLALRGTADTRFAQALSMVRRAVKHGDRTREPSPELRGLLEKAESLGRVLTGQAPAP